ASSRLNPDRSATTDAQRVNTGARLIRIFFPVIRVPEGNLLSFTTPRHKEDDGPDIVDLRYEVQQHSHGTRGTGGAIRTGGRYCLAGGKRNVRDHSCSQILEMDNGDFAAVGSDITQEAIKAMNGVVIEQGKQLDRLRKEVQRQSAAMQALELERMKSNVQKPPHF